MQYTGAIHAKISPGDGGSIVLPGRMKSVLRALQFFRPDGKRIALVLLLSALSITANVLKPWPVALILDSVLQGNPVPSWAAVLGSGVSGSADLILVFALMLFALHTLHGLLSGVQNFVAIQIGLGGLRRVRSQVFGCLQRLSLRFHQGSRVGDLVYRASWDTYSFQTLFQQGVLTFLNAALSLALMIFVMWSVNLKLTLVSLAAVPLVILAIRILGAKMRDRGTAAQQADSQVTTLVQQNLSALPLIQSYTREDQEQRQFDQQANVAQEKRMSQHAWELIYWFAISVVFAAGTAAIVGIGSHEVLGGRLSVGQLVVFLAYLAQMYEPLNQLSHVGATTSTALAATQRVFEVLDTPEEVRDRPNARAVQRVSSNLKKAGAHIVSGKVDFENVTFGYEKDRPVLHGVTLRLHAW